MSKPSGKKDTPLIMNPIRVGVVGVGSLGQHHARNYAEMDECELVGVVDVDRRASTRIAAKYNCQAFFDHELLFENVDAVSIVVPTKYHYAIAKDFLSAGIHTLIEKPITYKISEARELIDLAAEKKLILQVGHIERFNVAVVKLNEILTRPAFIECHRLGPYDPRVKDVGVVLDLMIHDIDIILQIVGSPIESIDAVGVPILSGREDIANARIVFKNGCIANLTVSRVSPNKLRKIRIFQADTYISLDYQKQNMEVYSRKAIPNAGPDEPRAQIVRKRTRLRREEPLRRELDHYVECVRSGAQPKVTGQHGSDALGVAIEITEMVQRHAERMSAFTVEDVNESA